MPPEAKSPTLNTRVLPHYLVSSDEVTELAPFRVPAVEDCRPGSRIERNATP
jgi:hypothetical protein